MRDIPVFTTDAGVASLTLKEIPYKEEAYIRLQDTREPEALLKECRDFCIAAGAQRVYASGHTILKKYPFHTSVWQMSRLRQGLPETDAALFPVQKQTLEQWRVLYNEKMREVANSAYMDVTDAQKLLEKGTGYFVHRENTLLGIGVAAAERINSVIAVVPGTGQDVLLALNHALSGERISVEVASSNLRAIHLYERLGFLKTAELSQWFQIY